MQDFPIFKTKIEGKNKQFNLDDPKEAQEYFQYKAGEEISKIKKFMEKNTFIGYLLGKKGAGKGTYSKLFAAVFGNDKFSHISVGDIVRAVDSELTDSQKKEELSSFLKSHYRGYDSIEKILESQQDRGTTKPLLSTEYILALLKREIAKVGKKSLFIDGLPRNLDQVSYSLFFRELIGYRDDPDFFVLFQVPESILDQRIKTRVVCPKCHDSKNLVVNMTKEAEFDEKESQFYLLCDNPACGRTRMVKKEGDELGIEPIRWRLDKDGELIGKAFSLYGVPKVLLRNSVPATEAKGMVDEYELTPRFILEHTGKGKVKVSREPWVIKDDEGVDSYSLMPPAVTLSMIKQIAEVLGL